MLILLIGCGAPKGWIRGRGSRQRCIKEQNRVHKKAAEECIVMQVKDAASKPSHLFMTKCWLHLHGLKDSRPPKREG